ncbi:MAG: hypothetical protein WBA88_13275 [Pseudaminobacter sp.]
MSFRLPKGRNAPPGFPFNRPSPDAASLHDRKLAAWALSVGASIPLSYPEGDARPHRGELADVDMRMAGPDPGQQPLLRRFIGWLGRVRRESGGKQTATTVSGTDKDAIGAAARMSYIGGKPVA